MPLKSVKLFGGSPFLGFFIFGRLYPRSTPAIFVIAFEVSDSLERRYGAITKMSSVQLGAQLQLFFKHLPRNCKFEQQ